MTSESSFLSYKNMFDGYASRYDAGDGRVALKILHTRSVTGIMERLCICRRLPEHTRFLAMLCALFHDIGRFEQLKQYDTFLDHLSCNHAEMSCRVLEEQGFLNALPEEDRKKILTAIYNHNRYAIEDRILHAAGGADKAADETLELCRLIRDADKCDIFRVFACEDMIDVVGTPEEEIARQTITPSVLRTFYSRKTVDKTIRETRLDFWVSFLAFFFDLNYPESVEIAGEQGYYRMPFDRTSFSDPETQKQVKELLAFTESYIREVLEKSRRETIPASLREFFGRHPRMALAFSGGSDSAYLLYAASACGCQVRPYYVATPFQPQFELDDAERLADLLHISMKVLPFDVLTLPEVKSNPADRCYYCKQAIFSSILESAAQDGYTEIMDGTNASDDAGDRPGMRALKELKVFSPLRECGITKEQLRDYSRNAGLFTWNKPAYACLATRIPAGVPIEKELLEKIERAENALFSLGFSDFRVRVLPPQAGNVREAADCWTARLQITETQLPLLLSVRKELTEALRQEFRDVLLDLNLRTPSGPSSG